MELSGTGILGLCGAQSGDGDPGERRNRDEARGEHRPEHLEGEDQWTERYIEGLTWIGAAQYELGFGAL